MLLHNINIGLYVSVQYCIMFTFKRVSGVCEFVGSSFCRRVEPVVRMTSGQTPLNYMLLYLKSKWLVLQS